MAGVHKIKQLLTKNNLDGLLISSVSNIAYLTAYSGFSKEEHEAYLFITKNKNYIITDARYSEAVNKLKGFILLEISDKNSLKDIFKKFDHFAIGFQASDLKVSKYNAFKKLFKKFTKIDLTSLRIQKNDEEIKKIKKACKIGDEAFEYILTKIRPGMTEKDLALELELFIRKKGASLSFDTIIGAGSNSATPHHLTSNQKLKTNDMILMDFGVRFENYCSDMTRVVFLGKATSVQKKVYKTVLEANKRAIEFIHKSLILNHKSIFLKDVDKVARDYIISQGYPSIPHGLGHGVGIEIHESPRLSPNSKDRLEEGMVFSIEPGIYKPNWGGIRIEDLVALEKVGMKILTKSPKNIIEL